MLFKQKRYFFYTLLFAIGSIIALFFKASTVTIAGTSTAFFSVAQGFIPLAGLYLGFGGVLLAAVLRLFLRLTFCAPQSFLLACYLPTTGAGLYWASVRSSHRVLSFIRLIIPAVCIILFCVHPVGQHAYLYSFFWFIPLATTLVRHQSNLLHALGSTFTAHAIGSVLWLYCGVITAPEAWLALIPVVALERTFFTLILYGFIRAITFIKHYAPRGKWLSKKLHPLLNR